MANKLMVEAENKLAFIFESDEISAYFCTLPTKN